jgi:hypothetical protein
MQVTTGNLKVGMQVTIKGLKGVRTIASISDPLESMPIKFRIGFEGIRGLEIFNEDDVWEVINLDAFKIVPYVGDSNNSEILNWETWKIIGWDVLNHAGVSSEIARESIVYAFKARVPLSIQYSWSIDFLIELCEYADLPEAYALRFYRDIKKSFESKE